MIGSSSSFRMSSREGKKKKEKDSLQVCFSISLTSMAPEIVLLADLLVIWLIGVGGGMAIEGTIRLKGMHKRI